MKKIFLSILAGAAFLIGCTVEEPVSFGDLDVDVAPSLLVFDGKTAGSADIDITAKAAWTVSVPEAAAEWLTITPTSGGAGTAKVNVSVLVGGDAARSAEVVFKAGSTKKILTVNQEGGVVWGTLDNPYTCAKACEFCATLADKAKGPKEVYVKGIITKIVEKYGTQYGNATFFMSDDGTENSPQFEVYRALYFDNQKYADTNDKNISIGDQVMVYGMIMNYGGQAETSQNEAYLVSLEASSNPLLTAAVTELTVGAADTEASFEIEAKNLNGGWTVSTDAAWITDYTKSGTESGKIDVTFEVNPGEERTATLTVKAPGVEDVLLTIKQAAHQDQGTAETPYTVAQAMEVINALEDGKTTAVDVYVKGIIASITSVDTGSYGNATYLISDNGAEANAITVFRGFYLENAKFTAEDQIAVGDIVVVKGKLQKYVDKQGVMTPEVAAKNYLHSITRPMTVAAALEAINALADGQTADEQVYVKGVVTGDAGIDTGYGNATFKITDNGSGDALTVFRAKDFDNQKFTDANAFKAGDTVILIGQLQKYVKNDVMTPELSKGWLVAVIPGEPAQEDGAITIDGNFDDWADIAGEETPDAICKVMKVTNDAKYFYVYLASEPGSRGSKLWGEEAGYYYLDFDWDNNPETGIDENSNPGFDCWCYLYIFGGTAEAPEIKLHPNGSGNQMSIENITAMGQITDELIQIELSIPREDMVSVAAGTETRILSWRSKDGTKIQMTYTVQ